MQLQFVGSGDAFGSGGRFNTCFHVVGAETNFLIDCGASSLIAMNRLGIDRNGIDLILLTHFHADHSGGVPFFILDAQFPARRTRPRGHFDYYLVDGYSHPGRVCRGRISVSARTHV